MDLYELSLSVSQNRKLDSILKRLEILESVTKELQKEKTSVSDVRAVFHAIVEEFARTKSRIYAKAGIVHVH